MRIDSCAGVLLAGGESSRFGSNKALARFRGRRLIEYPALVLTSIFTDCLLITNTPETYTFLDMPMTGDLFPGAGPLAGIHAALKLLHNPAVFVAACDMPFLDKDLIKYLCSLADDHDAVLPRTARGLEPLHAVYRRSALGKIEKQLRKGEGKIQTLLSNLKIRAVPEQELLTVIDSLGYFCNINRPEDLAKIDA